MATRRDTASMNRRPRTGRGAMVDRQNTTTLGGTPGGTDDASPEQATTQDRLQAQRDVADEKAQLSQGAPELRAIFPDAEASGFYTAVVRNGLSHRRNGIIFGAEPTTVDVSGWTPEQLKNFLTDRLMMVFPGTSIGGRAVGVPAARTAAQPAARDLAAALNERPGK